MRVQTRKVVQVSDWDQLVKETYGKPYSFQQQEGCRMRGVVEITVPSDEEGFKNHKIPEEVNGSEMGVSFAAWIARDPKQELKDSEYDWETNMWWNRNFYPDVSEITNDLHAKGILESGTYLIDVDW